MLECQHCGKDLTNINYDRRTILCFPCYEKGIKEFNENQEDIINKPFHYHADGFDPISIGEQLLTKEEMQGFYKMNILKYWYRAGKKDNNSKEQDLEKMMFYKNKLIDMEKEK